MEVLQVRPAHQVDRIAPSPKLSTSLVHQVRARLSKIPPVPTTIITLPEATAPEPLTNTTSLATSTTGNVSHSSKADTVATSILLVPSLFFTSKIHVAPTMHIEDNLLSMWEQRIRVTLKEILLHEITTGSCIQELMMAGKDPFHLKPTVVVTCGNAKTQKLVKKVFRKHSWLQDLLRRKGMRFVAVVQPVHLSSNYTSITTVISTQGAYTLNGTSYTSIITSILVYNLTSTQSTMNTNSPTATPAPQTPTGAPDAKLGSGAIAGIAVGSAILVVLVIAPLLILRRRKRGKLTEMVREEHVREHGLPWPPSKQRGSQPEMSGPESLERTRGNRPVPLDESYEQSTVPEYVAETTLHSDRAEISPIPHFTGTTLQGSSSGQFVTSRHIGTSRSSSSIFTYIDSSSSTPCGQKVCMTSSEGFVTQCCTFGGMILVAGRAYALSTGHAFASSASAPTELVESSPSTRTPLTGVSHADDDSSKRLTPFWFDPEDEVVRDNDLDTEERTSTDDAITESRQPHSDRLVTETPHMKEDTTPVRMPLAIAYDSIQPPRTALSWPESLDFDWALLLPSHLPRSILNKAAIVEPGRPGHTIDTTITEFADTIMQGNIHVLYGATPRSGHLCPSSSTIQVNRRAYDVKLVILNENLREYRLLSQNHHK